MASQKDLDRQKELNKLRKEGVLTSKEQVEQDQLEAKLAEEKLGTAKEQLELKIKDLKLARERNEYLGLESEFLDAKLELEQASLRELDEQINKLIIKGNLNSDEKRVLEGLRIEREDQLQVIEEIGESQALYNRQLEGAQKLAINLGNSIGLASRFQESFMGKMSETLDGLANNVEAQQKFKEQVKETFAPMNLLAGTAAKVFQSTMLAAAAYDQAATSFNAATGAAGEYNEAISDASRGMTHLGVGATEAGTAMGELHATMSSFSSLSKEAATTIAQGTAALTKLGISGETTAQNLELLTKHMGFSAEAAMKHQTQLAEFAGGIGVGPAKMASDFAAAAPKLIAYGAAGERVFKNLAITAKSTGIEMQALLGIAEQFDTFEGSAQAAGKLNAILGGPLLNSVELLTASEDERIQMMRTAVTQSGKTWESLNKFEKKAISAAAGISDLDTAGKMFGNNSEEVMEKQKNLNEMIEKSQAVTDKLRNIMMAFAISVGPLVDILSSAISTISEFVSENETLFHILGIVITALASLVVLVKAFVGIGALFISTATMMRAPIEAMKKPVEEVGKGMAKSMAVGIKEVGMAAQQSATALLKLGAAILMVGAGIGLAALGVAQLVASFAGLNGFQILGAVAAIGVFMLAIIGLAKVMLTAGTIATAGMFAFGAAFLLIGAGVKLMTEGIATMVTSFVSLLETAGKMTNLSQVGNVFKQMASGVDALGKSLSNISTASIQALAQLADTFVWLGGMTTEPSISFKTSMEGLATVLDAAKSAGVEVLMATATVGANFAPANKPVMIEPGGVVATGKQPRTSSAPGGSATQTTPTKVQLILNDREFARAVINVMDKKMNLRTG